MQYNQRVFPQFRLLAVCALGVLIALAGHLPVSSIQQPAEPDRSAQPVDVSEDNKALADASVHMTDWIFDGMADVPEVPEPSGMCYVPERDTLFVVDDGSDERQAGVYELDLHAKVLAGAQLGGDLEGICWCPTAGLLYACDESAERVIAVTPDGLKQVAEYSISRIWQGQEVIAAGGNGFEGIEYISGSTSQGGDYFLILNQDDPTCLLKILRQDLATVASGVPLAGFWELAQVNAGELCLDQHTGELWVIHSWMNVLEVLDLASMTPLRWEVFPGCAQEAVALDSQRRLWIGYDSGGIARYKHEVSE